MMFARTLTVRVVVQGMSSCLPVSMTRALTMAVTRTAVLLSTLPSTTPPLASLMDVEERIPTTVSRSLVESPHVLIAMNDTTENVNADRRLAEAQCLSSDTNFDRVGPAQTSTHTYRTIPASLLVLSQSGCSHRIFCQCSQSIPISSPANQGNRRSLDYLWCL